MGEDLKDRYLEALELLNLKEVERNTTRSYRTLQAYRNGERRITEAAAQELLDFLRIRAELLTAAADRIAATLHRKEGDDGQAT